MPRLKLAFEDQKALLAWAAPRCGTTEWPAESVAAGVRDEAGELRAVFVMNAFYDHSCAMHIASDGGRSWATRNILGGLFGYVYFVVPVFRVTAIIPAHNISAQIMALKLGFVFEGYMRAGAADGSNAIMMSMLAPECRWIKEESEGGKEIR